MNDFHIMKILHRIHVNNIYLQFQNNRKRQGKQFAIHYIERNDEN